MIIQYRPKRSVTGSRYKAFKKKRLFQMGRAPALTKLAKTHNVQIRTKGGGEKNRLLTAATANVLDQKTKKFQVVKIKTIIECPANKNYVRRNIMVKGTIIDTEIGKARVTSRPGQDGTVNAVLVA